jgi:tetratricopeptide (TPR) repeat protein
MGLAAAFRPMNTSLQLIVPFLMLAAGATGQSLSKGFEHFYNLEYDDAVREFRAQIEREPQNPNAYNHLAQAVLYREMFRAGALESELVSGSNPFIRRERVHASAEAEKTFTDSLAKSMSLAQTRIGANPKDTAALYTLGVAHGLRANYNFLVRKAWMDSLRDATAARKLHNQVVQLDPNFIDARLVQGVHDYVVGSLPWHWKMLGFIAGFRGDREEGIRTLKLVAEKGSMNKYDAQVLLAAIYRRERRPLDAIPLLKPLTERFSRNYLLRLEAVQMYSDAGDKTNALKVLDEVEKAKQAGTPGFASLPVEKIYYYRGNLLFWYRDFDGAIEQLRRVTPRSSTLDLNTAVMTWLRLGQSLDMKGRRSEAVEAYKQAAAAAPQSEAARESRSYLSSPYKRKG